MATPHPAIFIADSVAIDFLNSIATPVDVPVDWLDDAEGLLAWLSQAQLVPQAALDAVRRRAIPGELDQVAARARDLREWFRGFVNQHRGKALPAAALNELQPLNVLLERDEQYSQLIAAAPGSTCELELRSLRRWRSPDSLLLPIAEALAKLLSEENFSDIKACEGTACTLMFADHTRARTRRWCSMEICGNRAKQAGHRSRIKRQH
jgi:predicted RNA-binding Zn ribbon-like protein